MDRAAAPLSPALTSLLSHALVHVGQDERGNIEDRFARHAPALHDALRKLYGHRENFPAWLQRLAETMGQSFALRPAALRKLDDARTANPIWFGGPTALGYCAYVDRFGGTLAGVKRRIPHLQELGVTYLHLLPFLRMREGENDGGFAVANFEEIEPRLGHMADLRELTAALRDAGISLCSDFILNHVADTHPWAQAARSGDPAARAWFHTFSERGQVEAYEQTLSQVFPQAAPGNFTFDETMQRWVWTTFYPYQWDLNYTNPEVFAAMAAAMLHLANQGVEVFRLDSTAFLWKRLGTSCMNQSEVHWILQALRGMIEIVAPGVLLKAEAIVPTVALPAYLGDIRHQECHIAYHATLMASGWAALAEQKAELVAKVAAATPPLPEQTSWLTYVRCHDDIGWNVLLPEAGTAARLGKVAHFFAGEGGSYARGEDFQPGQAGSFYATNGMASALAGLAAAQNDAERDQAWRRLMLLYGLAFTFGGMPLLYMGDELGQGNDTDYRDDAARKHDSRWLQRPVFDEAAFAARLDASNGGRIYRGIRHLQSCRKGLAQLAARQPRSLLEPGSPAVLAYTRGAEGNELLFLANFSEHKQAVDLHRLLHDGGAQDGWHDVLSGNTFTGMLELDGLAQHWLMRAT